MYAVVFHTQVGNAAALAFTRFQRQQKFAAVVLQAAQFVELDIKAVSNHAPFAYHAGRFGAQRALQQIMRIGLCSAGVAQGLNQRTVQTRQLGGQLRQHSQRVTQARQVARTGAGQRNAAADAFDIDTALQQSVQPVALRMGLDQLADGILTLAQHIACAQRVVQPVAQPPCTHAGGAGVE